MSCWLPAPKLLPVLVARTAHHPGAAAHRVEELKCLAQLFLGVPAGVLCRQNREKVVQPHRATPLHVVFLDEAEGLRLLDVEAQRADRHLELGCARSTPRAHLETSRGEGNSAASRRVTDEEFRADGTAACCPTSAQRSPLAGRRAASQRLRSAQCQRARMHRAPPSAAPP
eukprot:scaffold24390_cov107-Isochrysis_galbana.AAC.4